MKIYTVAIQKGGTGKSTTAVNLAAGLTKRGRKVLAVDLDAQGNLSGTARASREGVTVLDLLTGGAQAEAAIQRTEIGDVIASHKGLAGADAYITGSGKEYRLRRALEPVAGRYDYIVLDTPPALGIITVNALTACTSVIIPAQADLYSLESIEELAETVSTVRQYCNPDLRLEGVLLTRYTPRAVVRREAAELAQDLAAKLGTKIFRATIREAVAVAEAQISQQSLFDYAPRANVTEDYISFIDELTGKE